MIKVFRSNFVVAVLLYTIALIFVGINTNAQSVNNYNTTNTNRFFTGGGLGLQFGDITIIDISPILGYHVTDNIAAGVGLSYQYYRDKRFTPTYSADIYGGSVFARYYFDESFLENFFLHAEYEILNFEAVITNPVSGWYYDRVNVPALLLGGGYSQPIGSYSAFTIAVLFDVIEDINSLYTNPVIRMGVNIGL